MNVLLFGPPGAGKGTQSALLVEKNKMRHISTGDLFRGHLKNGTELGKKVKEIMDRGDLVPDDIVVQMVDEVVTEIGDTQFILDGFPRTVAQAEALDRMLEAHQLKINRALFLEVPSHSLIERLGGRRVCKGCGAVYHITGKPPKNEGACDKCEGKVIQREDDQEEAIKHRLNVYEDNTKPLKDFYKKRGDLISIDGTGSSEEVFTRIVAAMG